MDFTKKGTVDQLVAVDPYKLLVNNGWEVVPQRGGGDRPGFMVWRRQGTPGKLFVYDEGNWQMLNSTRQVLNDGPDLLSLELFVTQQLKPVEHMG